jgi:hypothetical protein
MAQKNGDIIAKECRVLMKYLFLKENATKKMYDDMPVTLCDKHHSYSTAPGFRTGYLRTDD